MVEEGGVLLSPVDLEEEEAYLHVRREEDRGPVGRSGRELPMTSCCSHPCCGLREGGEEEVLWRMDEKQARL